MPDIANHPTNHEGVVQAVARKLCKAAGSDPDGPGESGFFAWEDWNPDALDALEVVAAWHRQQEMAAILQAESCTEDLVLEWSLEAKFHRRSAEIMGGKKS